MFINQNNQFTEIFPFMKEKKRDMLGFSASPAQNIQTTITSIANNPAISNTLVDNMKLLVPAAVLGVIGMDVYNDVKNSPKEDKKNVLINGILIAASIIAGGRAGYYGMKNFMKSSKSAELYEKFQQTKFYKNIAGKLLQKIEKFPVNDLIENMTIPVSAGIAGAIAGEIGQALFPKKYKNADDVIEKAGILADLDYGTMSKAYTPTGISVANSMDNTFSTLVGYSVGKEKGWKNKVQRFVYEIVSGVLVPLAVILPLTPTLHNKIPNDAARGAITLGLGICASITGKAGAKFLNKQVTDKIVHDELWEKINKKQQETMNELMKSVSRFDLRLRQQNLKKLQQLKEFKQTVNDKDFSVAKFVDKINIKNRNIES